VTYATACFIEDRGFEAVPVRPGGCERGGGSAPVAPDRPPAEVNINVRIAALACGLGEIGWSKVFIHPKFGPRVRLGTILTDAELEPDPIVKPGTLCNRCMRCARNCPGGAIPKPGERPPVQIEIEGRTYEWGDVHMGRCTLSHHGMNWECSPFLKRDFPGLRLNVRDSEMSEEAAYKLCYPAASATWSPTPEFPDGDAILPYYNQIKSHTEYFAICGARGCIRACMASLEEQGRIDQCDFPTPVFKRKHWRLSPPEEDVCGGVAEGKFPERFNEPDRNAGRWS
jgi:ferredoxin